MIARLLFIYIIILLPKLLSAQEWSLSNQVAGTQVEAKYSYLDDQKNTYILTSFLDTVYSPVNAVSKGLRDILLTKFNSAGITVWNKQIGSNGIEVCGGITINSTGELLITGGFSNVCEFDETNSLTSTGSTDIFIAEYQSNGVLNWVRNVGRGTGLATTTDIITDASSIVVTGYFSGNLYLGNLETNNIDTLTGTSTYTSFIAKFDYDGTLLWSRKYWSNNNNSSFKRVGIVDNGYYFGGSYQGTMYFDIDTLVSMSNTLDMFLFKTDLNGDGEWIRTFRGISAESFRSLETDNYQNAYLLGSFSSSLLYADSTQSDQRTYPNLGGYDTFIAKYNRSGNMQWLVTKGSSSNDSYYDLAIRNNVLYSTGYFANQMILNNDTLKTTGNSNKDAFLAVFNQTGDPITGASIVGEGNYDDIGVSVNVDNASAAYVVGSFKSPSIEIGDSTYINPIINGTAKNDLFFAIYEHPFTAVITDEKMISCNGLTDGMLEATPYFGTSPYTYSWSHNPSLNQPVADGLGPGTYTVTITDNLGKTDQVSGIISEPLPITITGVIDTVSCFTGSDGAIDITVTGGTVSGGYEYFWTSTDGSGIEPLTEDQDGLSEGHYNIEARDDNECVSNKEFYVVEPGDIIFNGSTVTDITIPPGENGAVDLSLTGGNLPFTFEWTGPGSFSATNEDIASLGTAGLYQVTVTDRKNCTADTTFAVTDATTMIAQIIDQTDITCFGLNNGTAAVGVINGQAPYSYSWSDGVVIANSFRSGLTPGKHTVTVTDALMHVTEVSVFIDSPASELTVVTDPDDLFCYNDNTGVVNLTVTGGTLPYSFNWDNAFTGEDLVNIPAGTYIVQVTDSKGCVEQGSAVVNQPVPIVLTLDLTGANLCPGDNSVMANAHVSGGFGSYSYLWNDPGAQITATAYDLEAGNYTVAVTDQNNCRISESVLVPEPPSFVLTDADYVEPSCTGDEDGAIVPWITGGTGGYSYIWSNNVFVQVNSNIPAGTYNLTIVDINNCRFDSSFILDEPDSLKIENILKTDVTCSGYPDGIITITSSGGTGSLTYSVDNGQSYTSSSEISTLPEGSYIVKIMDAEGCESDTVHVNLVKSAQCRLIIYDAFSPNGDTYNDVWIIGNIENYPGCSVRIFNSWGVLVFSSTGYQTPWDGKYNGNDLPSGTYYYVIDTGDDSGFFTGPVSIIY